MICPECGEHGNDVGYVAGVGLEPGKPYPATAKHCRACGCTWDVETNPRNDETKPPESKADELPGIKKALYEGDMDYVTDLRAEWLIAQVEAGRALAEFWRKWRQGSDVRMGKLPAAFLTEGDDLAGRVRPKP